MLRKISLLTFFFLSGCATYQSLPEEARLSQSGNYAQLETKIEKEREQESSIPTKKLYYLCESYSKLKKYNKLFPCLDDLEGNIKNGDVSTLNVDDYSPLMQLMVQFSAFDKKFLGTDGSVLGSTYILDISPYPHLARAQAHIELGDFDLAIGEARQALDISSRIKSSAPHAHKVYALRSHVTLGLARALGGDRAGALNSVERIKKLEDLTIAFWDTNRKNMGLAKIHMALGAFDEALPYAQEGGGEITRFIGDLFLGATGEGQSLFTWEQLPMAFILYKCLFETGQIAEAKAGYDNLLGIPQTRDNGGIYWLVLFDRGRIAEAEGNWDKAIDFYRRAIEVIEEQRKSITTETSKIGFVGDKQSVYYHIVAGLFATGRYGQAFDYVERSKARALVDLLAGRRQFAPKERDAAETKKLLRDLERLEYDALVQGSGPRDIQPGQRRDALADAKEKLSKAAPELASLVSVRSRSAAQIQARLGADEALVEYFYHGGGNLYGFVVTREGVDAVKLDGASLEADVALFRNRIMHHSSDAWRTSARSMYRRLIKPLAHMLDRPKLIVVPHGALHYVPFNALHSGEDFLIERYAIRLLPSASVLEYLKRRGAPAPRELLVFGNPDLGDPKFDLPGAEAEAREIAKMWTGSVVLLRKDATETNLKNLAGQFRYLHLASHGRFSSDQPLESGILLAGDEQNDGTLTVNELYDLEVNADVVTLSACETGLGEISNGDDVVGLTRGFLYAGARTIVASLWPVSDDATYHLMTGFYAAFTLGDMRESLRKAQMETKKKFPHPFFWAAFQIVGGV